MTPPGSGPDLPPVRPEDDDAGTLALDPAAVLPRRVATWAHQDPDRPFLEEVTGRRLTYGETWAAVCSFPPQRHFTSIRLHWSAPR